MSRELVKPSAKHLGCAPSGICLALAPTILAFSNFDLGGGTGFALGGGMGFVLGGGMGFVFGDVYSSITRWLILPLRKPFLSLSRRALRLGSPPPRLR